MKALLRAELLKLRTTRTFAALTAAAIGLSLLIVLLTTILGDDITQEDLRELFSGDFTSLFILLLGVMGMAGEWRHRTITSTVLAAPRRIPLLGAKVVAYAVAGAVVSLIVTAAIMVVGTVILEVRGETKLGVGDLLDVLWRNLAVAAFMGALGVCIGALVRNQVAAIVGVLLVGFVVEPTVIALAESVGKFGPIVGAPSAIQDITPVDDGVDVLSPALGALVLAGWVALGAAAGGLLLRRRDLI